MHGAAPGEAPGSGGHLIVSPRAPAPECNEQDARRSLHPHALWLDGVFETIDARPRHQPRLRRLVTLPASPEKPPLISPQASLCYPLKTPRRSGTTRVERNPMDLVARLAPRIKWTVDCPAASPGKGEIPRAAPRSARVPHSSRPCATAACPADCLKRAFERPSRRTSSSHRIRDPHLRWCAVARFQPPFRSAARTHQVKVFMHVALVMALSISSAHSDPAATEPTHSEAAFQKLLGLAGTWQVKDSTGDFRIVFEAVAGNTVLLETWMAGSSKRSLTVYHMDNDRLIATHYCPQGNQPRLQLEAASGTDLLSFRFFDATGIASPDHSHQNRLSFDFNSLDGGLVRSESYLKGGVEEPGSLSLVRVHQ